MRWKHWAVVGLIGISGVIVGVNRLSAREVNVVAEDGSVLLPNGWTVKPAGRAIPLPGDMPVKFAFSGNRLVVITSGFHHQGVSLIDADSEKTIAFKDLSNTWVGLAVDGDSALVSGGQMAVRNIKLGTEIERGDDLQIAQPVAAKKKKGAFTGGIIKLGGDIYAARTSEDSILRKRGDDVTALPVGYRPFAIVASPDGKTLAVSNWGESSVSLVDVATFTVNKKVTVGDHPNEMTWAKDGRLFVACASADAVSVVRDGKVVETIRTSIEPRGAVGATPVAVALTPDEKTLYVANADQNNVAAIDVSGRESKIKGFIPTGWYPSAVAVTPDGKKLVVGVGKGMKFAANYPSAIKGPVSIAGGKKFDYIGRVLNGWVSFVDVPTDAQLAEHTKTAIATLPVATAPSKDALAALKKIKHVVYVIRENRTYDQVLGDLGKGAGEPELTVFGNEVTPNAHALANQFTLLDNLYCNGEVSEDGHQWCNAAYATDFTQKAWINSYSGRSEPDGDDRLTASPAGYVWDNCRKHGLSYRSYGEFSSFKSTPDTEPVFTGNKGLAGHASAEWKGARDFEKMDVFIADLKKAEATGQWPNFIVMGLGEDHTRGLTAGAFTPQACVASNDFAIGKMIDAISHSKFWAETAIFIIEDDAQNGPDHIDAHRTVGFVISPYVKRAAIDSTHYTTASMLHTMELILGIPPMTQFDQRATPMLNAFMTKPDLRPYDAVAAKIELTAKNPAKGDLAAESAKLDFSDYDRADPEKLNDILWKALKPGKKRPAPVRSSALVDR